MWEMLWPVMIAVLSNVLYNICMKSMPEDVSAFGSLMVTYAVATVVTAVIFFATTGFSGAAAELRKVNWATFAVGAVIVGIETGYVFLYRAGWKVSTGSIVCNIALAVALVFVGVLLFKEVVTLRQVAGMVLCSLGLILITGK